MIAPYPHSAVHIQKEFLRISYFSVLKITRDNIAKALYKAARYAKGDLVDLGCGTKPYEILFRPYIRSYFGIDHPETAKSNYGNETNADLYVDVIETGLESETFDTLLSTQVMEHVYETKQYVSESYRLLKKGGIGIFTVPFVWESHAEPYDYYRFSKFALEKLFVNAGFEIIEISPTEGAYATLKQLMVISLSLPGETRNNGLLAIYKKLRNKLLIPLMNWQALHLDKYNYNEKLCLNYLVIVKK